MTGQGRTFDGPQPILLRVRDVAALLAVSERQVWVLIRAKRLPVVRPPGMRAIRIARADVEALVCSWRRIGGDGEPEEAV